MKDKVLIKGRKKGSVYLQEITVDKLRAVFFPLNDEEKYRYLGISYNIFRPNTQKAFALQNFYRKVDKLVKPWWCPRFVLRFLHLFGNDNSIVRVRNQKLHKLLRKLTNGVTIQQVKTKYGTLRVYGYFTEEVQEELTKLEKFINAQLEAY